MSPGIQLQRLDAVLDYRLPILLAGGLGHRPPDAGSLEKGCFAPLFVIVILPFEVGQKTLKVEEILRVADHANCEKLVGVVPVLLVHQLICRANDC